MVLTTGSTLAEEFVVTDYGARGNGVYENAQSIQKAIDGAAKPGGGIVLFPPGVQNFDKGTYQSQMKPSPQR